MRYPLLLAALATTACASTGTHLEGSPLGTEEDVILLVVSNAHHAPVLIDLIQDEAATRLGMVPPYSQRDFELPLRFARGRCDAKLRATSMTMGSPAVQQPVSFRPRQDVEFRVAFELKRSRITVPRE